MYIATSRVRSSTCNDKDRPKYLLNIIIMPVAWFKILAGHIAGLNPCNALLAGHIAGLNPCNALPNTECHNTTYPSIKTKQHALTQAPKFMLTSSHSSSKSPVDNQSVSATLSLSSSSTDESSSLTYSGQERRYTWSCVIRRTNDLICRKSCKRHSPAFPQQPVPMPHNPPDCIH
jgi:hypothetical protein